MTKEDFNAIYLSLPNEPGIYKYYQNDTLIYVGKAKNIKKRVNSYFNKTQNSNKTIALVKSITNIDFTITQSEHDALLLENSLIKEFQPKYNINLKDDKTYPWIVIKNEPFSRVFFTRNKFNDGSTYLGPYTSFFGVREVMQSIKNNFALRTCKLNLSEKQIAKKNYKVCLEYHLGNCKGPCVGHQSLADYNNDLLQIKNLLKGNIQPVALHFKQQMLHFAEQLEFEKANLFKQKIENLQSFVSKSEVVNVKVTAADVFSIKKINDVAVVNYLIVIDGNIVNSHNQIVHINADETEEEILATVVPHLQQNFSSDHTEIIVPFEMPFLNPNYIISIPKAGDKKKLLDFSIKNSLYHLNELLRSRQRALLKDVDSEQLLIDLQHDLHLQETPYHIECFDNSNFQGTNAVSAMVCFKNGVPSKPDYRHFNVKTVVGIDDFATMKEAVHRRYIRLKEEGTAFPQLVIIDGGKGQLSAANEAIEELGLQGKVTLVGLAKNVEEVFFVNDTESLKLPYNSKTLLLLRRIRDEVHRFGITHHRNKRSASTFKSELTNIEGIGQLTANVLLKHFKSISKIKAASKDELIKVVGATKASLVMEYFA
jgi:excinuclease ABC subunit C